MVLHEDVIYNAIKSHKTLLDSLHEMTPSIKNVSVDMLTSLMNGGTIYFCGNGGSAADAQHLAAELVGRFRRERRALRAAALSTDTSILTCIGNDYSFDDIFSRQVEAMVGEHDVVFGISTSGNSENVIRAIKLARTQGAVTIGLVGKQGGRLAGVCNHALIIPSDDTARIQEMHIMIGHILCELIEADPRI